ncbi:MAG: DUF4411 family protein [Candidatus Krumholzibacteria bacterium]|nr:DUF4411 family protein [Candidatus Krumholzibacteria bacterium]
MTYLLDANVFIQAKNLHYGLDFCPAFWEWLKLKNSEETVFSIEKVEAELEAQDDELSEWASHQGRSFFLEPDPEMLPSLHAVSEWALAQRYEPAAVSTFLQVADYYLIAHALAHGYTVVTHEKAGTSAKKIKIPDVCIGLRMRCMNPFEMLRRERARFVLEERR